MASPRWKGKALTTAEAGTVQVTGYDAATTYKLTVNGKVFPVIAAGSVNATATALAAAWNASTEPEPSEVTALAATDTVTFTADTAGKTFSLTSSVSGGAGTIGAFTVTVPNSGVNDAGAGANWDTGVAPTAGDTVYIDHNAIDLLWGLDQSGVGTVTTLQVDQSFTATIGLPEVNALGTAYPEYRDLYYKIRTTNLILGRGPGQGSGRLKIDSDSVQVAAVIENSGTGLEQDIPAILWKGTHASNTLAVSGNAQVGVAFTLGEVATVLTLTADENAVVTCGPGATLTTINARGNARVEVNGTVGGAITVLGNAVVTVNGAGAVTGPITCRDNARVVYNSTGALGGATVLDGNSVLDLDQDPRTKTISLPIDVRGTPRAAVIDNNKVAGVGLVIDWNGIAADVSQLGSDIRITRAATA